MFAVVRLQGGLGNQLFQIMAAQYIYLSRNYVPIIIISNKVDGYGRKSNLNKKFFPNMVFVQNTIFYWLIRIAISLPILPKIRKWTDFDEVNCTNIKIPIHLDGIFNDKFVQSDFVLQSLNYVVAASKLHINKQLEHSASSGTLVHLRQFRFPPAISLNFYYDLFLTRFSKLNCVSFPLHIIGDHSKKITDIIAMNFKYNYLIHKSNTSMPWSDFPLFAKKKLIVCSNSTYCFWGVAIAASVSKRPIEIILPYDSGYSFAIENYKFIGNIHIIE